jgi:hypothetical protein
LKRKEKERQADTGREKNETYRYTVLYSSRRYKKIPVQYKRAVNCNSVEARERRMPAIWRQRDVQTGSQIEVSITAVKLSSCPPGCLN